MLDFFAQGGFQAITHAGVRQINQGGFLKVIQQLAHQPGQGDGNGNHVGVKITVGQQGRNHLGHVILGRFNG